MKRVSAIVMATGTAGLRTLVASVFLVAGLGMIAASGFLVSMARDEEPSVEAKRTAESLSKFTWDVYAKLKTEPGNLCFSPVAIANSLALVLAGARGRTADQLAATLYLSDRSVEQVHQAMRQLNDWLRAYSGQSGCELHLPVALWAQGEYNLQANYLELGRKYYGVEVHRLAVQEPPEKRRQRINLWAEHQTKGKITQLIAEGLFDASSPLLLTNATYFQANWEIPFDPRSTREENFSIGTDKTVRVAMMHGTFWLPYYADKQVQLVQLPYSCTGLSMVILTPGSNRADLRELEQTLRSETLQRWLTQTQKHRINLSLPRFQVQGSYRLEQVLSELGCKDVFTPQVADLSGITGNRDLYLGWVVHKAVTTVAEQGTVAAAATALEFKAEPHEFRVNRPFLFLILDSRSALILFVGRVVNPLG